MRGRPYLKQRIEHKPIVPATRNASGLSDLSLPSKPRRARGMPGAPCAPIASHANKENMRACSHHRYAERFRHSPRDGFNAFLRALLGDRAFLPPSPTGGAKSILVGFTPASRRWDHTTSPSASRALRQVRTDTAIAFHAQRFVTTAKRPSLIGRVTGRAHKGDLPDEARRILTRFNACVAVGPQSPDPPVNKLKSTKWGELRLAPSLICANRFVSLRISGAA